MNLTPLPADARDEFERRAASLGFHLERDKQGAYKNRYTHGLWFGWQMGRKYDADMLAASPSPRTPEQPEQPILLWQHFDHSRPTGERMFWSHHSDRAKALADPDKSFNETCDTQPARTLPQSDPAGDQQHQHDDQHDADAAARPPAPAG